MEARRSFLGPAGDGCRFSRRPLQFWHTFLFTANGGRATNSYKQFTFKIRLVRHEVTQKDTIFIAFEKWRAKIKLC